MERIKVRSGHIAAIGYDPATKALEVEFQSGRIYRYFEFPPEKFEEMKAADSVGKFFNTNCKTLAFQRMPDLEAQKENADSGNVPQVHVDGKS